MTRPHGKTREHAFRGKGDRPRSTAYGLGPAPAPLSAADLRADRGLCRCSRADGEASGSSRPRAASSSAGIVWTTTAQNSVRVVEPVGWQPIRRVRAGMGRDPPGPARTAPDGTAVADICSRPARRTGAFIAFSAPDSARTRFHADSSETDRSKRYGLGCSILKTAALDKQE
jgi:hypothetical protein